MEWNEKNILVFGSGKSGISAAQLLLKMNAKPIIFDSNTNLDPKEIKAKTLNPKAVSVLLGDLSREEMASLDGVIMSPGVPYDLPLVISMKEAGIPIMGEIELAYQAGKGKVLAITGTNGKTTTTALLGQIMKDACPEVYVVGNIGNPYTGVAFEMTDQAVTVAEISSFQLETIQKFRPVACAITNITEDHLNRHHTMTEYVRVKESITMNQQPSDLCVLNYEDDILREFGMELSPRVVYFSSLRPLIQGIYLEDGIIRYAKGIDIVDIIPVNELNLLGLHNYENVMCAVAIAMDQGVPLESIQNTLRHFTGVEHRIEYVTEKNGVAYYNDSKGTNPDAAIKGIQAMNRKTVLIGGGYDKQSTYENWIRAFEGKVTYLVLIGQTKRKIAAAAVSCGFSEDRIIFCQDLKEAVSVCAGKAQIGEAVLLSPACASWDQFDNYEQRGNMFKEFVKALP